MPVIQESERGAEYEKKLVKKNNDAARHDSFGRRGGSRNYNN